MAQFFAAFSSPNSTDENGTPTDNSNNPEDLNAMQQQYQQVHIFEMFHCFGNYSLSFLIFEILPFLNL